MDILFVPFATQENNVNLIQMATRWQRAHAVEGLGQGQVENRVYRPNSPVLEDLNSADILHILAHGQGTQYVVNDVVPHLIRDLVSGKMLPTNAVLDANLLATRVIGSGLPRRHRVIKLSICNTNGTFDQFATAFKREMVFMGYRDIDVYYYMGPVSIPLPVGNGQVEQHVVFTQLAPSTLVPTPMGFARAGGTPVRHLTARVP